MSDEMWFFILSGGWVTRVIAPPDRYLNNNLLRFDNSYNL